MIPVSFDITLFIVAVLGAVVAVGMALLRQVLLYTERKRVETAEERVAGLRKKQEQMTEQYRRAQDRVREAEADIKSMHLQIAEVQRRLLAARADNYVAVHELGEPGGNRRLYTGTLSLSGAVTINQSTSKDSMLRGVRHLLEVWADTDQEAAEMVRRAFPPENGFILSKLQRPDAAPAPMKPKPMVRAAAAAAE